MNDIAFSVVVKNDGISDIIFKTIMLKGDKGNSVSRVEKTSTSGLVDTYTIYLTDGTAGGTFTVTNGNDINIDDTAVSYSKTWSSQKIKTELDDLSSDVSDALDALSGMIAKTGTIEDVAIASFSDGADDLPVSELIVDITASGGGGTPENPIPIVGFTECNITNEDGEGNVIDEITIDLNGTRYGGYVDVNNGKLVVTWGSVDLGSLTWQVIEYQGISYKVSNSIASTVKAPTLSSEKANIKCTIFKNLSRDEIDNYNYVICIDPNKNIDIIDNDYSTASDFTTAMSGIILAYELATPIEIDITPVQVMTLLKNNNIYADTGNIQKLVYFKTGSEAVAKLIQAYMRGNSEPEE